MYIYIYIYIHIHTCVLSVRVIYMYTYISVHIGTKIKRQRIPTPQLLFRALLNKSGMGIEFTASSKWGWESMRADICRQIENFSS